MCQRCVLLVVSRLRGQLLCDPYADLNASYIYELSRVSSGVVIVGVRWKPLVRKDAMPW